MLFASVSLHGNAKSEAAIGVAYRRFTLKLHFEDAIILWYLPYDDLKERVSAARSPMLLASISTALSMARRHPLRNASTIILCPSRPHAVGMRRHRRETYRRRRSIAHGDGEMMSVIIDEAPVMHRMACMRHAVSASIGDGAWRAPSTWRWHVPIIFSSACSTCAKAAARLHDKSSAYLDRPPVTANLARQQGLDQEAAGDSARDGVFIEGSFGMQRAANDIHVFCVGPSMPAVGAFTS